MLTLPITSRPSATSITSYPSSVNFSGSYSSLNTRVRAVYSTTVPPTDFAASSATIFAKLELGQSLMRMLEPNADTLPPHMLVYLTVFERHGSKLNYK
jgi:hypothetical protein